MLMFVYGATLVTVYKQKKKKINIIFCVFFVVVDAVVVLFCFSFKEIKRKLNLLAQGAEIAFL